MRKQVIAYLHTHWDREWYREFEIFRMRLLRVFDNILGMLDNNRIPCFYFDGQVSALQDYLEMRPEKEALVKALIREKRLFIGPFYCLIDEFLTDRNSFIKNLELGMQYAINLGCTDFIGYLADTFGHSENVVDILREFGIDKCIVWRGCGEFPAEFKWCGMDTVNLVRGYFNDIFSSKMSIEDKSEVIKKNLDLVAEKSGDFILLPIGADHLGVPEDIEDQIISINEILKDDYIIKLGSPFDYFKIVTNNFDKFKYNKELRDNSKTFILQGAYSSRLDLKRYNVECSYKLERASRFIDFCSKENPDIGNKYSKVIEYAYKMLLQNQAHDSICGCSTDDVHNENIIRYKKILQIAETTIEELKFLTKFDSKTVLNLSDKPFSGIIEFKSTEKLEGFQQVCVQKGFDQKLLVDTQRIPVTEDYTDIYTYAAEIKKLAPNTIEYLTPELQENNLTITDTYIGNSEIELRIENDEIFVNNTPFYLVDFIDKGDSYNFGPSKRDYGTKLKLLRSRAILKGRSRVGIKLDFESRLDLVSLFVTLDRTSGSLKFYFDWNNSQKNHLLVAQFELKESIKEVYSEDMNTLIKRSFDPEYDIRKNLPKARGLEAKTNTAPMQRGLLIDEAENNIGIISKGLTQYEIFENKLRIPILRSTGVISNPDNTARTTPAGPPLEVIGLQLMCRNQAEFHVFFGNRNDFDKVLGSVYNFIIS